MPLLLKVSNLFLKRGEKFLQKGPLSFSLEEGESICILGKNGTGKTTLLRLLGGLHPPPNTITWNSSLCFVGHNDWQSLSLTVQETTNFWADYYGHPSQRALEVFDLTPLLQKKVHTLSAGQKQRLALARLLCGRFQTWVIDEPFVHLDQAFTSTLEGILSDHLNKKGALVFSDHTDKKRPFPYQSIELLQEEVPS